MSSSGVMLSGWLRKSPPERKLRKRAWKKRWFVLRSGRLSGDPNLLEYYKHQGSKKPLRAISLDECLQIDANVPIKYERKDPNQQFVFDIVTKTRTYYFVTGSYLEMWSWVRYLCDLCGFNHDNSENQQNLGTEQQTFKAVQPIQGIGYQNGTASLLDNEQETPLNGEVPEPVPRPVHTITNKSILIREKKTDANGNIGARERQDQSGSSSAESGHMSAAGTPSSPRKLAAGDKNGYCFAADPSQQDKEGNCSDYLLLADFKTATTSQETEESIALSSAKLTDRERRSSTDSVFTHTSDSESDVIVDQPLKSLPSRFASKMRAQRLDSMPDCPPPPPPVKGDAGHPTINMTDEKGYSFPPDDVIDDDIVIEARTRSHRSSHGLSPIDDSENNRVPLNMQRQFQVDEMGNPITGHQVSPGSLHYPPGYTSPGAGTEYINTADASAEAGFGNFPSIKRSETSQQQYPNHGRPFLSPSNQSASSQFTSSVFFHSSTSSEVPYNLRYDVPSPLVPAYASPRSARSYNSPLSKGSIYSSASTLSPFGNRGSPMKVNSPHLSPHHMIPRMRRSSSVGQLESVANDLAAQMNDHRQPAYHRRCSIDHRPNRDMFISPSRTTQTAFYPVPAVQLGNDVAAKPNVPPPRPPKSEATVKQCLNNDSTSSPMTHRREAPEYFNLMRSHNTEGPVRTEPPFDPSFSPPHTAVIAGFDEPDSPPHTQLMYSPQANDAELPSPSHAAVVKAVSTDQGFKSPGKSRATEVPSYMGRSGSRSSSCSSSCSGSTSGSSRSQSPSAVYDISSASVQRVPSTGFNNVEGYSVYDSPKYRSRDQSHAGSSSAYDTPSKLIRAFPDDSVSTYDSPKRRTPVESQDGYSNYDTPKRKIPTENPEEHGAFDATKSTTDSGVNSFIEIDESQPSYEMMMNQAEMVSLNAIDDTQLYTTMSGVSAAMNLPPFARSNPISPISRPAAISEPPPVKRDLKPGRKSIGSDSDQSKLHLPKSSYDEFHGEVTSPSHTSDGPLSPPHTVLMHSSPNTPAMIQRSDTMPSVRANDRLAPPGRPPKYPSQSSLSPRTPPSATIPSHLPGRSYPVSHVDRNHKVSYDNQTMHSPQLNQGPRQRGTPNHVPGRPPKPMSMKKSTPPTASAWEEYPTRYGRDFGNNPTRPPKSSNVFPQDYGGAGQFFPSSSSVVPPPPVEHVEKELKYVELRDFPTSSNDATPGGQADGLAVGSERPPRPEGEVEYIVLDQEKTEALQKMRIEREKEQLKRTNTDNRSIKGGKS